MKGLEKRDENIPRLLLLSSGLIVIAIFGLLVFAISTTSGGASSPFAPPDIEGEVSYTDGTPVVDAIIILNNTNKTDKETQTKTTGEGTWCIRMESTIDAENGDIILITVNAPDSVEQTNWTTLVVDRSNYTQEVNFVFKKKSEAGPPSLPSNGDGGGSDGIPTSFDELLEEKTNATAMEEEKDAGNVSEQQSSPSPSPSPSPSGIREGEVKESVAGEGQSETPSPLKEGEEGAGKSRSIPGFQLFYAGIAGLIAIATLFIIRRIRVTGKGGIEKR